MLHSKVPCPPGVRANRRGASSLWKTGTTKRVRKCSKPTCIFCEEGNKAVPVLRMYNNSQKNGQIES